jgi:hypothetical protein
MRQEPGESLALSSRHLVHHTAVCLLVVAAALGCTCGVPGLGSREFACSTSSDCADGYFCNPDSGTCSAGSPDGSVLGTDAAAGSDASAIGLDAGSDAGTDSGTEGRDAGPDSGAVPPDAGPDAGIDSGSPGPDASSSKPDAGPDAGADSGSPGLDAGPDAGSAGPDAGSDAGASAGCDASFTTTVTIGPGERGTAVEFGTTPRFLIHQYLGPGIDQWQAAYIECTSGCSGPNPMYSPGLTLEPMGADKTLQPQLVPVDAATLGAVIRTQANAGGKLEYAECITPSCAALGDWGFHSIDSAGNLWDTSSAGFASLNDLRAIAAVWQTTLADGGAGPDQAVYAECPGGCAGAGTTFSRVVFGSTDGDGASIALAPLTGGNIRRAAVWGDSAGLYYAECSTNCTTATSWRGGHLPAAFKGAYPAIVMDSTGSPRIFYVNTAGTLEFTSCTATPPCVGSDWNANIPLLAGAGFVTAGVTPSGLTYFASDDGTNVWVGIENSVGTGGGYAVTKLKNCGTAELGISPSGYTSATNGWRMLFSNPAQVMLFHYDTP